MKLRRRGLLAFAGALVFAAVPARAQQAASPQRVGLLFAGKSALVLPLIADLREGLAALGWVEGRNLLLDVRLAEGDVKRIDALAGELIALKPVLVVAATTLDARAVRRLAPGMSIVVGVAPDPVADGLVASLARPGGNITGMTTISAELEPKRLQLLKEFFSDKVRIAILTDPSVAYHARALEHIRKSAPHQGVELLELHASTDAQITLALARLTREKAGGLLVMDGIANAAQRPEIIAAATALRIPAMYASDIWTNAGALMSYGVNYRAHWRHVATFVDRILKGAKPADLPIEQPTRFELIVNLKAAKAQGIKVPQSVLVRADRVVE